MQAYIHLQQCWPYNIDIMSWHGICTIHNSRQLDWRSDGGPLGLLRLPNMFHRRLLPSPTFSAALAFFRMFAMSISFSKSRDVFSARCAFALSSRAPANIPPYHLLHWLEHATESVCLAALQLAPQELQG